MIIGTNLHRMFLAQGAYYITSNGEAAIIDPLREVQPYIDRAVKDNVKIKYILKRTFMPDFVSGHVDLAAKNRRYNRWPHYRYYAG